MIATPNSVRGLDFPALTHVYAMYLPFDDPREYVHLAGRVGRVGQMGSAKGSGGRVIAVLKQEEASKMDELAKNLGFEFTDIELDEDDVVFLSDDDDDNEMDVEKMRRYLEDTLTLVTLTDDPSPMPAQASGNPEYAFDDDDDDESDFDDEGFE